MTTNTLHADTVAATNAATSLQHFVDGEGTVRAIPYVGATPGSRCVSPAFPTYHDVEQILCGAARLGIVFDARERYSLVYAVHPPQVAATDATNPWWACRESPVQLNKAPGCNSGMTFVWKARRVLSAARTTSKCVIKASVVHEMPYAVRLAFDALCEVESDLARGAPVAESIYATIRDAIKILFSSAGRVSGMRIAKARVIAALGSRKGRSAATATAAAATASADDDDDAASPVCTNDPLDGMTNGEAYLGFEPIIVAARLMRHLEARMPPASFRGTALQWREHYAAALEPARSAAARAGLSSTAEYLSARSVRAPRYAHAANGEAINEIVAGSYATFLHHARVAPAIAPVEDYFTMPVSYDVPGHPANDGAHVVFTVSPFYHHSLQSFCTPGTSANPTSFEQPTLENLAVLRSLLAQILASLASAQRVAHYTHYDCHASNIRVARVRTGMPEYTDNPDAAWHYATPAHGSVGGVRHIYIPATDAFAHVARIIDHGRTRVDRPGRWGCTTDAAHLTIDGLAPSKWFDAAVDVRALAHDIMLCILEPWTGVMSSAHSRAAGATEEGLPTTPLWEGDDAAAAERVLVHRELCDFVDVLEAMTGVRTWTGWSYEPNVARGDPRVHPRSFMQYAVWVHTGVVSRASADAIRCNEFINRRAEPNPDGHPAAVLELPFFKTYHTPRTPTTAIHDVADFEHGTYLQRTETREFIRTTRTTGVAAPMSPARAPRGSPVAAPRPARRHPKRARK